ncbi:MAG TPA: C1 family peptidase [Chitinophagaceae bacterium]|nr:C1 family peptidase [Chitinophagaceae bacterium]
MIKFLSALLPLFFVTAICNGQDKQFTIIKNNPATSVKNQGQSGTCWCYSTTAMTESELLLNKEPAFDLSETFTVYNLYIDKAIKYIRRRGNTRFAEGGLAQDMLNAIASYGAVPQEVYPGIGGDTIMYHDYKMEAQLKSYLDSILNSNRDTIPPGWKDGYVKILNGYLGEPPAAFKYNGEEYTPKSFAAKFVKEKPDDFIGLTSFTHHPFYTSFVMEVPDNYNSNAYYNLPLNELINTVEDCIMKGYTIAWDADVSNKGFRQRKGVAMWVNDKSESDNFPNFKEDAYTQEIRQELFDKQITQDDHLMQITGIAKDADGNKYFIVKNSWGLVGPFQGFIYVSIPYFAINTISVVVDKRAVSKKEMEKLAMK